MILASPKRTAQAILLIFLASCSHLSATKAQRQTASNTGLISRCAQYWKSFLSEASDDEALSTRLILGRPLNPQPAERASLGESYRVIGSIKGDHGGDLFVLKAKWRLGGRRWFGGSKDGFKGDPNWIIELIGKDAAPYLGIQKIDQWTLTIPDAAELNGALRKLNATLGPEHQVDLRFYKPEISKVPDLEYLRRFVENFELPVAESTRELPHDINYHLNAIFLPTELLQNFRARFRALSDFEAFVHQSPELQRITQEMSLRFNAGPTEFFSSRYETGAKSLDAMSAAPFSLNPAVPAKYVLLRDSGSYLDSFIQYAYYDSTSGFSPERYLNSHFAFYPEFKNLLKEFIANQKLKSPDFANGMSLTPTEVYDQTRLRIEILRKAMEALRNP